MKKIHYVLLGLFVILLVSLFFWLPSTRQLSQEQKLIKKIKTHLDRYVHRLYHEYSDDPRVQRLYDRYKITKMLESVDYETYTLNKGQSIHLCVKNYEDKTIHDDFNLLVFVSLHELAHVMSLSIHHSDEFWKNFKFILVQAVKWDMYYPVNYAFNPMKYCKMVVYDNPFYYETNIKELNQELINIIKS